MRCGKPSLDNPGAVGNAFQARGLATLGCLLFFFVASFSNRDFGNLVRHWITRTRRATLRWRQPAGFHPVRAAVALEVYLLAMWLRPISARPFPVIALLKKDTEEVIGTACVGIRMRL